jgi:uncharacterized protein (DUF302 family)
MNKFLTIVVSTLYLLFSNANASADHGRLIMGRSLEAFPETMSLLQEEIKHAGYTVSVVQRVDIGLTGMGYTTDKYRVVFFGTSKEMTELPKKYPELAPYLPLAIAIFAEGQETILSAMSPQYIAHDFSEQYPELSELFNRWEKDMIEIINRVCRPED